MSSSEGAWWWLLFQFHAALPPSPHWQPRIANMASKKGLLYTCNNTERNSANHGPSSSQRSRLLTLKFRLVFSVLADESADTSNKEQLVVCIRWIDDHFEVREELMSPYHHHECNATAKVDSIKTAIRKWTLIPWSFEDSSMMGAAQWPEPIGAWRPWWNWSKSAHLKPTVTAMLPISLALTASDKLNESVIHMIPWMIYQNQFKNCRHRIAI